MAAKTDPLLLQLFKALLICKCLCALKCHVFNEMGQALLGVGFLQRACLDQQPEFHILPRIFPGQQHHLQTVFQGISLQIWPQWQAALGEWLL